jgi:hypothetical protein
LKLYYNYKIPGHIAKECHSKGPICLCCKGIGNKVEDFPRMITKVENINMRKKNYEEGQKTKDMLEN